MNHGTKNFLRMQGPLLGLIGLMFLIFFAQALFGPLWYQGLMVVPADVGAAWERLLAGQSTAADGRVLGTLLSYAFLHGDFEHVLFNMLFFWIFGALIVELLG
jgi:membrane associated rhomboid family serine protease